MAKQEKAVAKCGDVFDEYVCEREAGHDAKRNYRRHRDGGVGWTDGGKERVLAERAAAAKKLAAQAAKGDKQ